MVFRTSQAGLQLGSHIKSTHCLSAPFPALQQCPAGQSTHQPSHTFHSLCFFCMEYALQLLSNPPPINSTQKSLCLIKYHHTLVRMANIKKHAGDSEEKKERSYVGRKGSWYSQDGKTVWRFRRKLKIELPYDWTPGNISRQNYNSKRHMHSNVHSSTIHNSQDMETAIMSMTDE